MPHHQARLQGDRQPLDEPSGARGDLDPVEGSESGAVALEVVERGVQRGEVPAGAAGVAALMSLDLDLPGPICVVTSGGNIDPLVLSHVTTAGLTASGRFLTVTATIPDRPGGLISLLELLREKGASVVDVVHSRVADDLQLGEVQVTVSAETRGAEHQEAVRTALADAGFLR